MTARGALALHCAALSVVAAVGNVADEITEQQVLDFLERFEEAQGTADFDAVAPLVHPDGLFRFNDGDYRGLDAARAAFERTWALDVEDERYHLTDVEVLHVDSDSATATFRFHWSGSGDNGPFHIVGRGTSVIVRHDGRLKLLVEHLSR